jgi:hypothetical protein
VLDKVPRREFVRCQHGSTSPYNLCIFAHIAVFAAGHNMKCGSAVMCPWDQLLCIQGIAQGEGVCVNVTWDDGRFGAAMDQLLGCGGL